jgi:hypothetical protein
VWFIAKDAARIRDIPHNPLQENERDPAGRATTEPLPEPSPPRGPTIMLPSTDAA